MSEEQVEYLIDEIFCNKYKLEKLVGIGGMAYVFQAQHLQFEGSKLAIKLLFHHLLQDPLMQFRFRKEASLQFNLSHPNIVRVIDFIEERGHLGIVMDWIEGCSLNAWLAAQNFPLDPNLMLALMTPICEGVHYAHACDVVHRDLKPGNILLTNNRLNQTIPKILDFGIAKAFDDNQLKTKTGISLGTPAYMSPEQIRGERDIDHRTDLYALGVLTFLLLTGVSPFERSSSIKTVMAHIEDPIPRLKQSCRGVDTRFQRVLDKAMAKSRDARYDSVEDFLSDLHHCIYSQRNVS
ncbi:MAG: serine/threonine-protein kinase, partial [Myxococcota bacterium]